MLNYFCKWIQVYIFAHFALLCFHGKQNIHTHFKMIDKNIGQHVIEAISLSLFPGL